MASPRRGPGGGDLALTAGGGVDVGTEIARQLQGDVADAAGAAMNQHALSLRDAPVWTPPESR